MFARDRKKTCAKFNDVLIAVADDDDDDDGVGDDNNNNNGNNDNHDDGNNHYDGDKHINDDVLKKFSSPNFFPTPDLWKPTKTIEPLERTTINT